MSKTAARTPPRRMPDRRRIWAWGLAFALSVLALVQVRGAQERAEAARAAARLGEAPLSAADALVPLSTDDRRRVLDRALRAGDFAGVRAMAAAASGDPVAPVFVAAAQAEEGDEAGARAALQALSPEAAGWGPGARLRRALELRIGGAGTLLRDRDGALLGTLAGGALQLEDEADAAWVPRAAEAAARSHTDARSVRLTLDRELSRLALLALAGHRGSIVLLDPRTGAVLTAVSDARTLAAEGGTPSFEQRREPASILKLVTTSAAFAAGLDPDAEIAKMTCDGHARYGKGELWCAYPAGRLSGLDQALAISCNVAFANLGTMVGRERMLATLRLIGFDRADAPWAGHVLQAEGDALQLANLSVGLTVTDITPLHAALLAAMTANEGTLPEPSLVSARDSLLGLSPRAIAPAPGHPVLDARFLPVLRRAMVAVTQPPGTAAEVAVPRAFPIAMKTGTASQPGAGYHVNYVGVGPLPSPRVAFCVRVTHEGDSKRVNAAAREVMDALLEGLARRFPAP